MKSFVNASPILCAVLLVVCFALYASACGGGETVGNESDSGNTGTETAAENPVAEAPVEPSATADTSTPQDTAPTVTLIGDSVVLGGVNEVKAAVPGIDIRARTDRGLSGAGLDLLKEEAAGGKLGDIVVLALGTNSVKKDDIAKAMDVIGAERQVVFVNAYRGTSNYIKDTNEAIDDAATDYAGRFTVADWYGYVTSHPDIKLAADDCHLTKSSAADYAGVIKAGVDTAAAKLKGI
jgi:hypothetical protein